MTYPIYDCVRRYTVCVRTASNGSTSTMGCEIPFMRMDGTTEGITILSLLRRYILATRGGNAGSFPPCRGDGACGKGASDGEDGMGEHRATLLFSGMSGQVGRAITVDRCVNELDL